MIKVSKDGVVLSINERTLDEHKKLGWQIVPMPVPEAQEQEKMTVADIKKALDEKGIEYDAGAKKAELLALLEA